MARILEKNNIFRHSQKLQQISRNLIETGNVQSPEIANSVVVYFYNNFLIRIRVLSYKNCNITASTDQNCGHLRGAPLRN